MSDSALEAYKIEFEGQVEKLEKHNNGSLRSFSSLEEAEEDNEYLLKTDKIPR